MSFFGVSVFPGASQMIQVDLPVNVEKTQAHPLQSSSNDSNVQFPLGWSHKKLNRIVVDFLWC